MPMHVKVSGVWQQVLPSGFHVKISGVWQPVKSGWTRVAGVWQRFHIQAYLNGTMTVGDDGGTTGGFSNGLYGSISPSNVYTDGAPASRTIVANNWNYAVDTFQFLVSGASVPDTDATFSAINVNGIRFVRSARTSYSAGGPNSQWLWTGTGLVASLPGVGTVPYLVEG